MSIILSRRRLSASGLLLSLKLLFDMSVKPDFFVLTNFVSLHLAHAEYQLHSVARPLQNGPATLGSVLGAAFGGLNY
jgi:hypothetical protein